MQDHAAPDIFPLFFSMNKKNWDIDFTDGYPVNGVYRFDKPIRVNDDPSGNWHYAPSLAVDDENNVCIAWLDARNGEYDICFNFFCI